MPFSLQLRHTKSGRTSGQDLRLQAPEIHALLDSREFLTFVDVVRCDASLTCLMLHMVLADQGSTALVCGRCLSNPCVRVIACRATKAALWLSTAGMS